MVSISPDIAGRIRVTFPYSPEVVAKIKTIETRRWHPEGKYWSFEHSKPILDEILSALSGQEIEFDPSLRPAGATEMFLHQALS